MVICFRLLLYWNQKNCSRHCRGLGGPCGAPQSSAMTFGFYGCQNLHHNTHKRGPKRPPHSYAGARMKTRTTGKLQTPAQFPFLQNKMQPKYFLSLVCDSHSLQSVNISVIYSSSVWVKTMTLLSTLEHFPLPTLRTLSICC